MNNENTPVLAYPRLGRRTFLILIIKRMGIFFFLLCIGIAIFVFLNFINIFPTSIMVGIFNVMSAIGSLVFLVSFALAVLEYVHYSVFVYHGDVKIRKGLISMIEYGFPYRKIKEVRLERSLIDQILGISNVYVFVSGEESSSPLTVSLPFLRKDIAILIRDEILKRTQVEDINIESGPHRAEARVPIGANRLV